MTISRADLERVVDHALKTDTLISFNSYCNCLVTHLACLRTGKSPEDYLFESLIPNVRAMEKDAGLTPEERGLLARGWDLAKQHYPRPDVFPSQAVQDGFDAGMRYLRGMSSPCRDAGGPNGEAP